MELSLDSGKVLIKSDSLAKTARTDIIARIAGVLPLMGLYAALAGMFVYALLGTSRQLAVTLNSSSAAMLAALVRPIALGNSGRYALLVSAATVAAGAIFP